MAVSKARRLGFGDLEVGAYDCVWLPKGTGLSYLSSNALVFHAILPANWMEGGT